MRIGNVLFAGIVGVALVAGCGDDDGDKGGGHAGRGGSSGTSGSSGKGGTSGSAGKGGASGEGGTTSGRGGRGGTSGKGGTGGSGNAGGADEGGMGGQAGGGPECEDFPAFVIGLVNDQTADDNAPTPIADRMFCADTEDSAAFDTLF
jgi:hypothetical protein